MRSSQQIIDQCRQIAADPLSYLRQSQQSSKRRYLGYTCIFGPEELLHAAGFIPVRLLGFSKKLLNVEKYLPTSCCEFARSLLETIHSNAVDFCDGIIMPHCCDALHVVADILPEFYRKPIYSFNSPTNFTPSSHSYCDKILLNLKAQLEQNLGTEISEASLRNSWQIYVDNRLLGQRLYQLRRDQPGVISGHDCALVMLSGLFMPKEEHNQLLQDLLTALASEPYHPSNAKKIIVCGSTNGNTDLLQLIETSGALIVDDDLCETSRGYPRVIETDYAFPQGFTRRMLASYCPVKVTDFSYKDYLIDKYQQVQARGIIFAVFCFCDPQELEFALLKHKLKQQGIRALSIEIVVGKTNFAQLETRVEAFLESL